MINPKLTNLKVGKKLKEFRIKSKKSQEQVSDLLFVSQSNISKLEKGNINISLGDLEKYCKIYNVSVITFINECIST
jgi:transcriptional regulator with XRE-family HTH domain